MVRLWFLTLLLGVSSAAVMADEVVLTNSSRLSGIIVTETPDDVTLEVAVGLLTVRRSEIAEISRATPAENATLRAEWDRAKSSTPQPLATSPVHKAPPSTQESTRAVQGLRPGQRPPSFSATDLSGGWHALQNYRGQILVLHFWATWCPHCRAEIPKLKQIHQLLGSRKVSILAVSVDEDLSQLSRFVQTNELPYPVVADVQRGGPLSNLYAVSGIPTTYVLDREGLVVNRFVGESDLVGAVRQLLNAPTNGT